MKAALNTRWLCRYWEAKNTFDLHGPEKTAESFKRPHAIVPDFCFDIEPGVAVKAQYLTSLPSHFNGYRWSACVVVTVRPGGG